MKKVAHYSHMHSFYLDEADSFLEFLRSCNEKEILIKTVIKHLEGVNHKSPFIFTDIGAGSGIVAKQILEYSTTIFPDFTYNFIEQSEELIHIFQEQSNDTRVNFIHDFVENTEIPKSDFILVSHVFQYIADIPLLLGRIYESLKPGGVCMIIGLNNQSHDVLLKKKLGHTISNTTDVIVRYLHSTGVPHKSHVVESNISETNQIIDLEESGKRRMAFICNMPFENIQSEHIKTIRAYFKEYSRENILEKKEDYIIIQKSEKVGLNPIKTEINIPSLLEIQKDYNMNLFASTLPSEQQLKQSLYSLIESRMFRYAVRIRDEYRLKTEDEIKARFYEIVRDIFSTASDIALNKKSISTDEMHALHRKLFPKGLWGQVKRVNGVAMKALLPVGEFRTTREFRMYDGAEYDYMPHAEIEENLQSVESFLEEENDIHFLVRLAVYLHRVWFIHPYYNGNGTLFMIIVGIRLVQNGYIVPKDMDEKIQNMIDKIVFLEADNGNIEPLIRGFLDLFKSV